MCQLIFEMHCPQKGTHTYIHTYILQQCEPLNFNMFHSGANDGMGFPFLFLALFLISEPNVGTAIGKWIYITLLFQIALSCVIGLVVGWVARKILQWSERK